MATALRSTPDLILTLFAPRALDSNDAAVDEIPALLLKTMMAALVQQQLID